MSTFAECLIAEMIWQMVAKSQRSITNHQLMITEMNTQILFKIGFLNGHTNKKNKGIILRYLIQCILKIIFQ